MTIVCGIDFFAEHSRTAVQAAARLASRMNMPLHLVHASDLGAAELTNDATRDETTRAAARLLLEDERLSLLNVNIQIHAPEGAPEDVLLDIATQVQAKLIVVAANQGLPGKWRLGSHADRLAQRSHVPVLVVRDAGGFADWVAGRRALRVLAAVDFSLASEHAMRWVGSLCAFGPCEISAIHLYWPPDQFERLGLSGVRDHSAPHPEVVQAVRAQFGHRFMEAIGSQPIQMMVQPHTGRPADGIAKQAEDDEVDLLVVGSHAQGPIARMMEGSVSRGVLDRARVSVACVPAPRQPESDGPGRIRNVLVATDFTDMGNAAIKLAHCLVAPHGTVHLAHVVPDRLHRAAEPHDIFVTDDAARGLEPQAAVWRRLNELRLPDYSGQGASVVHVLQSDDPAEAIAQAAERLDVDLICLGTRGRGGISRAAFGSVAQAVLHRTERPVLYARAPKP